MVRTASKDTNDTSRKPRTSGEAPQKGLEKLQQCQTKPDQTTTQIPTQITNKKIVIEVIIAVEVVIIVINDNNNKKSKK